MPAHTPFNALGRRRALAGLTGLTGMIGLTGLIGLCGLCAHTAAWAHAEHAGQHEKEAGRPVAPQRASFKLVDATLQDQHGRSLNFKTEVLAERIAIVGFAYTTCTTTCPVVSAVMAQAQAKLGTRLGREVAMVTLTVDPLRDTPARLKAYASKMGAGPGWAWLTGARPQVDEVLKSFGAYTANYADHPPLVLVGDAKAGTWLRFYGFPTPDQLVAAVNELAAQRSKAGAAG